MFFVMCDDDAKLGFFFWGGGGGGCVCPGKWLGVIV